MYFRKKLKLPLTRNRTLRIIVIIVFGGFLYAVGNAVISESSESEEGAKGFWEEIQESALNFLKQIGSVFGVVLFYLGIVIMIGGVIDFFWALTH